MPADQSSFRRTTQYLAPLRHPQPPDGEYDIYPGFPIGPGKIRHGFRQLADTLLSSHKHTIIIDGYIGVLWDHFRQHLEEALTGKGIRACWHSVEEAMKPEPAIDAMIAPFLGGDDPVFGTRCHLTLRDFFDNDMLSAIRSGNDSPLHIICGCGAALVPCEGFLVYVDVPKNEIQFRSRAGNIRNLGARQSGDAKEMYKRFYFVDWPVLNRHRVEILPHIAEIVDAQRPAEPAILSGNDFRDGLDTMARNFVRARPWFEPGPWGGDWIRQHIPQLSNDVPNYAWSFELISPENGIAFESDGLLFEVSFDFLMFHNHREILGDFADRFGYEFPIRYDFLDTFHGGNLSLQCHPRPEYINKQFGECFTQDETYYILDCEPGARVYLGFNDNVDVEAFRAELDRSIADTSKVNVERYVNTVPSSKHDLLLIPNGTIHCSGVNNLVLEISATPYIFTLKMYDWMRMDLDGEPRPLNIQRAFDNLYFDRQGERIRKEFTSHPVLIREGSDWKLFHLPTHSDHFYDVHRFEFSTTVESATEGSCHVLNLVEGESIVLKTAHGMSLRFNYAETFVIPAAAGSYELVNQGPRLAKVVKTFLKPGARPFAPPEGARE